MCLHKWTIIVNCKMMSRIKQAGFSIVELLVVITVIGILASVVMLTYSGIQGGAHDEAVKTDLRNAADQLEIFYIDNKRYPSGSGLISELGSLNLDLSDSYKQGTSLLYCIDAGASPNYGQNFGIAAISKSNKVWGMSNTAGIKDITAPVAGNHSGANICPKIPSATIINGGWTWSSVW